MNYRLLITSFKLSFIALLIHLETIFITSSIQTVEEAQHSFLIAFVVFGLCVYILYKFFDVIEENQKKRDRADKLIKYYQAQQKIFSEFKMKL